MPRHQRRDSLTQAAPSGKHEPRWPVPDPSAKLFAFTAKAGVHRLPGFHRAFLTLYPIYKQHFEAGPIDRLREFVPDGSLVIDVGANIGFFSLRFAEWVGDDGKVTAIEPEDRNYESLPSALKRAGLGDRVQALKVVAAAEPGMTFRCSSNSPSRGC